jgi:hypothetical protein
LQQYKLPYCKNETELVHVITEFIQTEFCN